MTGLRFNNAHVEAFVRAVVLSLAGARIQEGSCRIGRLAIVHSKAIGIRNYARDDDDEKEEEQKEVDDGGFQVGFAAHYLPVSW